jgi:hypothetical protein
MLNDACHLLAPYLSRTVYDLLAALPAAHLLDHRFHTDAISQWYPEYADLPYETKSRPKVLNRRVDTLAFALKVARYCLFTNTRGERVVNKWSYLAPRLLKGMASQNFGTMLPDICARPIYLTQLTGSNHRGSSSGRWPDDST